VKDGKPVLHFYNRIKNPNEPLHDYTPMEIPEPPSLVEEHRPRYVIPKLIQQPVKPSIRSLPIHRAV
jgi:hypothetical protein